MRNDSSLRKSVRTARRCAAIGFATAAGCLIGLLFLLTGGFVLAAATPAFVQEKDNQVVSGLTNRTTFSAATIAGNLIVVYLIWDNTGTASVSDSLGNAYVSAVGPTRWTNNSFSVQTFYTINLHGGADSVTATFATAVSSFGILYAHEYSGVLQTKPVDVTAAASGASGPLNSGSAATTNAVDLLFAGGVSANVVTGPGAGYTARSTLQGNITEDKVVAVNGPNSATASNGGGAWALQMVAFKGAAGGTLDTTPPTAPTNLSVAGTTASTVSLSWIAGTDNVGQTGYKIYRGGLQVGTSSGAFYTDTGRAASTTYAYTVSAFDAAGNNSARSATVNATTAASSGADTAPPAVSITSPQQNAIVSSSATVAASAADNVGVASLQFQLDGASLGSPLTAPPYSVTWNTTQSGNGIHTLTAMARDGAGNAAVSAPTSVTVNNATSGRSYTTNFPASANPVSEGGNWIDGKTNGLDWQDVRTTPGLAFGTEIGNTGFDDSTAILSGNWGPDQTCQATVHSVNQNSGNYEEVECRLRSAISAHSNTGYEINFRCVHDGTQYVQIVRWNGLLGSYTYVNTAAGPGIKDGDVVKATISGNTITAYINNVQIVQGIDSTYSSGNPGMGFYLGGGANNSDYGFASFAASDTTAADKTAPSVPSNLAAAAVSASQIGLIWTASTDNVAVAGYHVLRNNSQLSTTTSTGFSDTTVTTGTQYTYAVSAFDAAGNVSAPSPPVTAATAIVPDAKPPSVPTGLQASKVTSTALTVTWSASTDNVAVAGYQVFRNGIQVATTTAASYADTGLTAITTYAYTVAAQDASNNLSGQSLQLMVTTTAAASTPPLMVQVNNNQVSAGSAASVTFNAPTLAGNTIVAYVIWNNTGTVVLTDTHGDTFTGVGSPVAWGNGSSAQIFYSTNIAAGMNTVTASFRIAVTGFGVIYVHEYAGISAANAVDVTVSAAGSSAALNSGAVTTTSPNDLIFAAGVSDNIVTAAGSGFTSRDLAYGNITQDRVAGPIGSYGATATHNGKMWGMQMVAFRAAH